MAHALADAEAFEIAIEATPEATFTTHRAWALAHHSLPVADAIYVAAAGRQTPRYRPPTPASNVPEPR